MRFNKKDAMTFLNKMKIDINNEEYTLKDVINGLNIELEHGNINKQTNITNNDLIKTGKIALAHLNEDPKYYKKLKKIEGNNIKMKVQSVLFKKDFYDDHKAKKWLEKHKLKPIKKVHHTKKYLRYRIRDPSKFQKFRIMQVRKNIKFVMGLK